MPTVQEAFNDSLQDQNNLFQEIKLDNSEIVAGIPLQEMLKILSKDPENIAGAIILLEEYYNEVLIPAIRIEGQAAVNQAIQTFLDWSKSLK